MLGNYKMGNLSEQEKPIGFAAPGTSSSKAKANVTRLLGQLATDPNTSLYATQALVRHATADAMQALISALTKAEGWAKVDVVEACLELRQEGFYDLLVVRGLEGVAGLESYVAIPIYCSIPLERYLCVDNSVPRSLSQQAALLFAQVLHDSMTLPSTDADTLPAVFKGPLATVAHALFAYARSFPDWQSAYAVHRLGTFLGRYWAEISRGVVQDSHITEPIYKCLTMMPEVERWIDGPGRDVLLTILNETREDEVLVPAIKVLGELRDPRAFPRLTATIEAIKELGTREHALYISTVCDMLVRSGDRRAVQPMLQLIERVVDINRRVALAKRRDNLPSGDADIPGSIVYAAVIRACGQFGQRSTLENVTRAMHDFDPYVRTQAIEALKRIDSSGEDASSHRVAREALSDPRDVVVRLACYLIAQYRDVDALPELQHIVETRPDVAPAAYEALRQMGQVQ
jgi:HEAT repeat protein